MVRAVERSILAGLGLVLGLAAVLAGCSPGPMIDRLPGDMGLPAGTPARPPPNNQYPAVYDTPPPRSAPTMSEEQQLTLEKELTTVRDKQESRDGTAKKAAPPKKKKPADANNAPAAGAKDGVKTNP